MNELGILVFKISLTIWLELNPFQQAGLAEAVAQNYGRHFSCAEVTLNIIPGRFIVNHFGRDRELLFFIDCPKKAL